MKKITVLIPGYARENDDGTMSASSTTTLVESNGKQVLVDPGTDAELLVAKLKEHGLTPGDIDIVFLTHYHIDHLLNIRLFPDHAIYDGDTIYQDDKESFYEGNVPDTDIQVVHTPGHAYEHVTLVVEVDGEKYAIAQDLFWWMDGEQRSDSRKELLGLEDPYAKDVEALRDSRRKVLDIADWIIPGHGKMFKVPNQ